jgi:glycerate kinase
MKVVIAPDSLKECASAREVAEAIARGVRRVLEDAEIVLVPMADGGEGTVDALVAATAGRFVECEVTGPLGERTIARYGLLGDGKTAVIEMAAASGLALAPVERRDPRVTTTRGTGELMVDALDRGVRKIILGIGGSATNDAGAGMAQALGFSLRDGLGRELEPGGAALARLAAIDGSRKHGLLNACEVLVACDVDNPLCGARGASAVYGPQKGADAAAVKELDAALGHFAKVVETELGVSVLDLPGAGAAGGLGAGLAAFAGARLAPGVELVAEASGLAERLSGADLVFTGEGRLDGQTAHGKTPVGVARIARSMGIPVVALAGALGDGYEAAYAHGVTAAFCICPKPVTLADAVAQAPEWLAGVAEAVMRLWLSASQ